MRLFAVLVIIAALVSACDSNRVFEDNKDFEKRAWNVSDTVAFEFAIADENVNYNLLCNIRNTMDYPFSRIFVNYTLQDSARKVIATKLVTMSLFEAKSGYPFGNSGIGDIYDHRFPLLENRKFAKGKYFVKLQHVMRTDTTNSYPVLPGILAAGVRVEKVEPK